ncbi:hypothetical protein [Streptomyces sp. NBC_00239]|uniref:hypothetical protein n=1 Tax=Streptomyces sp. NBC_00239 TaxID=2903640 RepID=UPI002E295D89|nr:hypothetical protein [Streptomyces sp. NBC_00239]
MPKFAASAEEADQDLREYCESIGFDPEWVAPEKWASSVSIAQQKQYGFEEAHKTIDSDKDELRKDAAAKARKAKLAGDAAGLIAALKVHYALKDSLVREIIDQCAATYLGGERVNLGLGGKPMDRETYSELRKEWRAASALATGGVFSDFVSHDPQDKAALGKGAVGATLARRGVQGNLLMRINGVRFNMHIDIAD